MKVVFIVSGELAVADGRPTSPQAGIRYRALRPTEHLPALGWHAGVTADQSLDAARAHRTFTGQDVVVLSGPLNPVTERLLQTARALGARTIIDVCDNHFVGSRLAELYRTLCGTADQVTASTPEMAEEIHVHTGRRAAVIPDPVEGARGTPEFAPHGDRLRVLWFGGTMNLDTLPALVTAAAAVARVRPVDMTLLTADHPAVRALLDGLPAGVTGRLAPWTPGALEPALRDCDVVVLPSGTRVNKRVKSANRLTEALWGGRWVVAHPQPSFLRWAEVAAVDHDLAGALLRSLARPEEVRQRIAAAQERIAAELQPAAVAARWSELFVGLLARGLPRR